MPPWTPEGTGPDGPRPGRIGRARSAVRASILQARAVLGRAAASREGMAIALLALLVIGAALLIYLRDRPAQVEVVGEAFAPRTQQTARAHSPGGDGPRARSGLFVHVAGAVRRPGVYQLAPGSRVDDAVKAAGGMAEGAEPDAVNLAEKLRDGQQVLIPRSPDPATTGVGRGTAGARPDGKISLNRASAKELEELPGVGPTLAERIAQYRDEHGGFRRLEELRQVEGIGDKKYEQIVSRAVLE